MRGKYIKLRGKRGKIVLATILIISLFLTSIPALYNLIQYNNYGTYSTHQIQFLYNSFQNKILTKTPVDNPPSFSINPFPNNTVAIAIPIQSSSYRGSIDSAPILQSPGSLNVTGILRYYDNIEGVYYPCRYATTELWDKDSSGGDDLLYTGTTDSSGTFNLGPVDNTDEEGGTQDIYVKVYTNTSAVMVYDGANTYVTVFPTVSDVPDGTYDYGTYEVDSAQRGAWNIYDQVVKGYQWIDERPDTDPPPRATVKWYQGNTDGTHYHPGWEIHILGTSSDPDEFDDGIILHEYGHFIADRTWPTKPYSFDNSPGGSHTWDGTYTPELAWSEGWAHYFACIVRSSVTYRDTYNGDWVDYNLETGVATYIWGGSYDGNANGDSCEAAVAGVLWDISDSVNDDQDGDGIGDELSLSADMIWYVLRVYSTGGHGVYTIYEFWSGWFNYYTYYEEMWDLFYEHGITDDTAPSNPSSYWSSPTVDLWSTDNTIYISWSGASDSPSGVYGYSFVWDNSPSTIPDTTVDTTGTSTTSSPLSDSGNWYFHVRTRDNFGNWASGAYHVGPFRIDTVSPNNPTSYSSSHTPNIWSNDNTIFISWSGASDGTSGVYGYSFVWDTSPTTIPDTTIDTTGTITTSSPLSDGSSWYFHVRTRDNAGHWASGAYHVGPFRIDTVSPNNPISYSSSHTPNIWSNDSTIFISWSGASDGLSGVYGYSFVLSTSSTTIPDTTDDTSDTSTTSPSLSDGSSWYFHVRTRDNAGNWASGAYHVGPFCIDDDILGPSITNPRVEDINGSAVIHSDDQFRFLVNLYEDSGISLAEIHYDFDGNLTNGYQTLTLNQISGDLYGTDYIGPFASGDIVWQVYAADGDNDRSNDTAYNYSDTLTLTIRAPGGLTIPLILFISPMLAQSAGGISPFILLGAAGLVCVSIIALIIKIAKSRRG
ncbi:MAG: hypothetical protein ACETWM_00955 [Candidatus Lokiarchaeia archaeon]